MEVSTYNSKIMANCHASVDISMKPEVRAGDQFQVTGINLVQGWHMLSRNQHTATMARLNNTISFTNNFKSYKSLVISILRSGR